MSALTTSRRRSRSCWLTVRAERDVIERVLQAHGADHLERATSVRVRFSSGGLAFRSKGQPKTLLDAEAVLAPARQEISVRGARPRPWQVVITDSQDLKARLDALHTGTRLLRWTPEEVGVFAAGALWTYITLPLLLRDAPHVGAHRSRHGDRLVVRLDERVAGHAPWHVLHVDSVGRFVRHDYTATAFGRWAHAAQVIETYQDVAGAALGTTRRVTPRVGPWRLPGPTLVWIQVHDVLLE
jgi:hypothetical protein